jgi:hypothetical protein
MIVVFCISQKQSDSGNVLMLPRISSPSYRQIFLLSLMWETKEAYVGKRFELFHIQIRKRKHSVPFLISISETKTKLCKKNVKRYIPSIEGHYINDKVP